MKSNLRAIWLSCILQMKLSFMRPMFQYSVLIDPVIFALITYTMFKDTGVSNFIDYVVLGTGMSAIWNSICFSSAGDIDRERGAGTLELIVSVPTNFKIIVLGKILGNTIFGSISLVITYLFIKFAFNPPMNIIHPLIFISIFVIALISYIALASILAALITLSRNAVALKNCIGYPVIILSGMLFPIEILPAWTTPLSYILSPTWAVKLLRECVNGIGDYKLFIVQLIILIVITVMYYTLSFILYNIIDKSIRIKGTLGVI